MELSSSTFNHNGNIPARYTCDGENINPPLKISQIPRGAKSLVLISDDPDAPTGTWVHWLVWNIAPDTVEISENSVPKGGFEGKTSFGSSGYGGPCPPSGTHRYFFKIYALDNILDLPESTVKEEIMSAIGGHILDQAEIIGFYKRQQSKED